MLHPADTTDHLAERLATIKGWAREAEYAVSGEGGAALRCVGALCDVVQVLTDRVLSLETAAQRSIELIASLEQEVDELSEQASEHVTVEALRRAILAHRDTWHTA